MIFLKYIKSVFHVELVIVCPAGLEAPFSKVNSSTQYGISECLKFTLYMDEIISVFILLMESTPYIAYVPHA